MYIEKQRAKSSKDNFRDEQYLRSYTGKYKD